MGIRDFSEKEVVEVVNTGLMVLTWSTINDNMKSQKYCCKLLTVHHNTFVHTVIMFLSSITERLQRSQLKETITNL
jgi:hypothetical protein